MEEHSVLHEVCSLILLMYFIAILYFLTNSILAIKIAQYFYLVIIFYFSIKYRRNPASCPFIENCVAEEQVIIICTRLRVVSIVCAVLGFLIILLQYVGALPNPVIVIPA